MPDQRVPSVVALCLALKYRVERITARTGDEQQHRAAHHRHIFPEVAGLVNDLCWLRFPIAVRAEGCDDDEQQYQQRRVAGGEADDQQDTANELNEGRDIAQEFRQAAARHRGGETRDVHEFAPATHDEDPAQ